LSHAETILIIESEPETQRFLRQSVLGPVGYRTLSAFDGHSGLILASEQHFDLLILDVHLPGKSGLDILREFRRQDHNQPAIMILSPDCEKTILPSLHLGVKDFLQRPLSEQDVLSVVTNALAESRWQRERAYMTHAITEQVKNWALLHEIGQAITSTLEEPHILRHLVKGINQLMRVEAGSLFVVDDSTGSLGLKITLQGDHDMTEIAHLQSPQRIAEWVAQHNQPVLVPDVLKDQRFFSAIDQKIDLCIRSVLAVPLSHKGKVMGVIQVINPCDTKAEFNQNDLETLQILAAYVAVAVENARLHAKVRQAVKLATLKQTVVTLSHYINNSLAVFTMISETLRSEIQNGGVPSPKRLLKWADAMYSECTRIAKTIAVLNQVTSPRAATYLGETQMIDIDAELQTALKYVKDELSNG
jgi:DNA-binding response OmpR family regulator/putative methionine-R-sulfoxide reductase with GAF domain